MGGFGFVGRRGRWREEKIQFHCSLSQVFLLFCFLSFSLFSLFLLLPQGLIFGPSDDDSYREKKRKKSFAFSCSDFSLKKVRGVKNFSFLRWEEKSLSFSGKKVGAEKFEVGPPLPTAHSPQPAKREKLLWTEMRRDGQRWKTALYSTLNGTSRTPPKGRSSRAVCVR